ncbi:hypothetical protein [Methylomonas fluvii]|nr:hypothetical protein [Methylomonas fluvii]
MDGSVLPKHASPIHNPKSPVEKYQTAHWRAWNHGVRSSSN